MLERLSIGLNVDVDTLRGTREGVPRLAALFKRHGIGATFYFSVGPDHTGRALRRVFRKGFAKKVARTSVLKHYGIKTLMYGVLLPGPHIGREAGDCMRKVRDQGFEVGLHTFDHVRWQDHVARQSAEWTRAEFARGMESFKQVFGSFPASHAAAGWQMNAHGLELEREYSLQYASDTRGSTPFFPVLPSAERGCMQLPTTLPTFDELLGRNGVEEGNIAESLWRASLDTARACGNQHVFTLHAELEGMRMLPAFEALLRRWRESGAELGPMSAMHARNANLAVPQQAMVQGEVEGRSGLLAVQGPATAAAA